MNAAPVDRRRSGKRVAQRPPRHDRRLADMLSRLSRPGGVSIEASAAADATGASSGIPADLFARARERGLIERCGAGRWRLSAAGRAWQRRAGAADEPFRAQHGTLAPATVEVNGHRRQVRINGCESPLGRLARRKDRAGRPLISTHELAAGERLREDFTRAHLMPSVTSRWEPVGTRARRRAGGPRGAGELVDSAIAARARVNEALVAVGPDFADVLVDVCCFLKGVEEMEQANGWPVRSGKLVLRLALAALARHYGFDSGRGGQARRRLRQWGAPGYRPEM